jgi:hypothetical protein
MPKPALPEPLVPILCIVAPVTIRRVVLGSGPAVILGHLITIPALHWLLHVHIRVIVHSLLSSITLL